LILRSFDEPNSLRARAAIMRSILHVLSGAVPWQFAEHKRDAGD
jgi:hypothetical protein